LHRAKVDELVLEDFVRSLGTVNHLPFAIVPDDGRSPQTFQNADLNFLRVQGHQPVKTGGKAVE